MKTVWNKGKKLSEKHRRNLSLSHIGNPSSFKGKKHSPEAREKIRIARAKQIIKPHSWEARKKLSEAKKGYRNPQWKGGRKIHLGYVMLLKHGHPNSNPQGYVFEHRYVMSQHLGRPLLKTEIVHHKNEIKTDNRIENLVLVKSIGEHKQFHKKHEGCSIDGCENKHQARGFCRFHYGKWRHSPEGKKTEKRKRIRKKPKKPALYESKKCSVEGCDLPYSCRNMCNRHYMKWFHKNRSNVV